MQEIFSRRSIRAFNPTPVEDEKLELVLSAGNYAPSAMNNQDRQFTAIVNESVLQALNDAIRATLDEQSIKRIEDRLGGNFHFFYGAPVLIVVSHFQDGLYPEADCACALENMFLQAKELGLGSCWINQLNKSCDLPEIREILTKAGVNPAHKVFGCCALGYSDSDGILFKEKQSKIVICK